MAKVIKAVLSPGNDVDFILDCGHELWFNLTGSAIFRAKDMIGQEYRCEHCAGDCFCKEDNRKCAA